MDWSKISEWFCNAVQAAKANEFNKGYATGVAVVLAVVVLMLVIKIIFKIIFRRSRRRELLINSKDGEIKITAKALEDTVRAELADFKSVKLSKLLLYSVRKKYQLDLICDYDGSNGSLVEVTGRVREVLNKMFIEFFGVENVRSINLKFERLGSCKKTEKTEEDDEADEVREITAVPVSDTLKNDNDDIF